MFKLIYSYFFYIKGHLRQKSGNYTNKTRSYYERSFDSSQNVNIKFSYIRFKRRLGFKLNTDGFFLFVQTLINYQTLIKD